MVDNISNLVVVVVLLWGVPRSRNYVTHDGPDVMTGY